MTIKLYLVDQTGGGPRAFQTEVVDLDAANAYIRSAEEKPTEEIYFEQGLMFVGVDEDGREYWQEGQDANDHRLTLHAYVCESSTECSHVVPDTIYRELDAWIKQRHQYLKEVHGMADGGPGLRIAHEDCLSDGVVLKHVGAWNVVVDDVEPVNAGEGQGSRPAAR